MTQHPGINGNLNQKQRALLVALLAGSKTEEAAASANVSKRTAYRWQQDPKFQQAMKEEQHRAFDKTLQHLMTGTGTALKVLLETMTDKKAPYGVRVAAARTWLENAITIHKSEQLEAALEEMEATLKEFGGNYVSLQ